MKTYFEPTLMNIGNQKDSDMLSFIKQIHSEACNNFVKDNDKLKELILKTNAYHLIELEFSNRLRTSGGNARTKLSTQYAKITLNYKLFTSTGTREDLKNTYLHELAHVIANRLFQKQCGHGKDWQTIAKKLGCNADRCHTMEVNHLRAAHTKKEFKVYCPCKTHNVTRTMWNKINTLSNTYHCKLCKGRISCTN